MAEALELWLVRHGETTRSAAREIAGWSDPPLTARGENEARALRSTLTGPSFDSVWSSDLQRTIATARLAWGEARPDERLRELNFGDLETLSFDVVGPRVTAEAMAFRDFKAPGGEASTAMKQRVEDFLAELPSGRHLLFVHGGVIRVLTQDMGLDRFVATGSVIVVDWKHRRLLRVVEPNGSTPNPGSTTLSRQ